MEEKELDELKLECVNAKVRMKEAWQILQELERIAKTYWKIHDCWRERFEKADRQIAMEERRSVTLIGEKKKKQESLTTILSNLSKEQLLTMAQEIAEEEGGE